MNAVEDTCIPREVKERQYLVQDLIANLRLCGYGLARWTYPEEDKNVELSLLTECLSKRLSNSLEVHGLRIMPEECASIARTLHRYAANFPETIGGQNKPLTGSVQHSIERMAEAERQHWVQPCASELSHRLAELLQTDMKSFRDCFRLRLNWRLQYYVRADFRRNGMSDKITACLNDVLKHNKIERRFHEGVVNCALVDGWAFVGKESLDATHEMTILLRDSADYCRQHFAREAIERLITMTWCGYEICNSVHGFKGDG